MGLGRKLTVWCSSGGVMPAQMWQRVLRVGLDYRFSGRISGEGRRYWRGRRLPVFLHRGESIGFMMPSVVPRRLHGQLGRRRRRRRRRMGSERLLLLFHIVHVPAECRQLAAHEYQVL